MKTGVELTISIRFVLNRDTVRTPIVALNMECFLVLDCMKTIRLVDGGGLAS